MDERKGEADPARGERSPDRPRMPARGAEPPVPPRDAEQPGERVVIRDRRKRPKAQPADESSVTDEAAPAETVEESPAEAVPAEVGPAEEAAAVFVAEQEALRAELDERTRDLQRMTAEYANYRKRVERDRAMISEQAVGGVLAALLPVLDDLDRARDHGDLVGPFGAVAEQLTSTLGKFGLAAFGEPGDRFDPTRHDAVAHQVSGDVEEPTCVDVLRRGYMLGERLLRPALVAVAEPAHEEPAEAEDLAVEAQPDGEDQE